MKPKIEIFLKKIEYNAKVISDQASKYGINITGVTKLSLGMPEIANAMLRGGVRNIGESRLENIETLRQAGIQTEFMLIRIATKSEAFNIVKLADISLNSEIDTVKELNKVAIAQNKIHKIIAMIDLGDLREGMLPYELDNFVKETLNLSNIELYGLGANLTDLNGVLPSNDNSLELLNLAKKIEAKFNINFKLISACNSSSLPIMYEGNLPPKFNHMRLGESICLGVETAYGNNWINAEQNAFVLQAEIIELKEKNSKPKGEIGRDAFGNVPIFEDKGKMLRGILNIGRQDCRPEGLFPLDQDLTIIGATSDHLIIDFTHTKNIYKIGDIVKFNLNYGAILALMTSKYIEKNLI